MERDPNRASDYGADTGRDLGDEPPGSLRDHAPDILSPIDASAPVSGHVPAPDHGPPSISESPEQNWGAAAKEAVKLAEELPLSAGLRHERRAFYALFATDDQTEGMAAFIEKRRPDWKGR